MLHLLVVLRRATRNRSPIYQALHAFHVNTVQGSSAVHDVEQLLTYNFRYYAGVLPLAV